MKLFAPAYYKDFRCIASRCLHSCCVGWEIDVDEETMQKYTALAGEYADEIRGSIDPEGGPHFRLDERDRCPHLDQDGLCRIITALGDGCLCEICREHPRFYHDTAKGKEVGLGLSCEEACRLILSSDNYAVMEEVGEAEGTPLPLPFDPLPERARIYAQLADEAIPYERRLAWLSRTYGVSLSVNSDKRWRALLSSLEYLSDTHRALFASYSSKKETKKEAEPMLLRAFAYFIYRHVSRAESEDELRSAVGFALFLERLLASMVRRGGDVFDCARILSEEIEYSEENTETIKNEFLFY